MDYNILCHNSEGFFVEITLDTFRTRIETNFNPSNFSGFAISCNYHYQGHPLGFLKDNGLILGNIEGRGNRPIFEIGETIIQAGPTLIENFKPVRNFKEEKFNTHDILSGFHTHIGRKKFGNYIIGFTKKLTLSQITKKYVNLHVQDAIKLPGLKQGGFIFKSSVQEIREGIIPIPVALIFESKIF